MSTRVRCQISCDGDDVEGGARVRSEYPLGSYCARDFGGKLHNGEIRLGQRRSVMEWHIGNENRRGLGRGTAGESRVAADARRRAGGERERERERYCPVRLDWKFGLFVLKHHTSQAFCSLFSFSLGPDFPFSSSCSRLRSGQAPFSPRPSARCGLWCWCWCWRSWCSWCSVGARAGASPINFTEPSQGSTETLQKLT